MDDRYSKHKYDIKNRTKQNNLDVRCHREVFILDDRNRLEDNYSCKAQTSHEQ